MLQRKLVEVKCWDGPRVTQAGGKVESEDMRSILISSECSVSLDFFAMLSGTSAQTLSAVLFETDK